MAKAEFGRSNQNNSQSVEATQQKHDFASLAGPTTPPLAKLGIVIPEGIRLRPAVRDMLEHLVLHPERKVTWQAFVSINDWRQFFLINPAWHDRSKTSLQKAGMHLSRKFIEAFERWAWRLSDHNDVVYSKVIDQVFPNVCVQRPRPKFNTLKEWHRELSRHPEWRGLSARQIWKLNGRSFVEAFTAWARTYAVQHDISYQTVVQSLFPKYREQKKRFRLNTIGEWKAEFAKHPEWQGKSSSRLCRDFEGGGSAFLQAFRKWVKKESKGDRNKFIKLMKEIFPTYRSFVDWSKYRSIQDWKTLHATQLNCTGKPITALRHNKSIVIPGFVVALSKWAKCESKGDKSKYVSIMQEIFPSYSEKRDRKRLTSVVAWKAEFLKHPEWHGKQVSELQRQKTEGARAFMLAFYLWAKKESGKDAEKYASIVKELFPDFRPMRSWKDLTEITHWKAEHSLHPKWYGKTMNQVGSDRDGDGRAFVLAFRAWVRRQADNDVEIYDSLIREIFPTYAGRNDWASIKDIATWKVEFLKRSHWHGKTMRQIRADKSGGGQTFINGFLKWVKRHTVGDRQRYTSLVRELFPGYIEDRDWSDLKDIPSWKAELGKHSEWRGKTAKEIKRDLASGGRAFVQAFNAWIRRQSLGSELLARSYSSHLFPVTRMYTGEAWFDSKSIVPLPDAQLLSDPLKEGGNSVTVLLDGKPIVLYRVYLDFKTKDMAGAWAVRSSESVLIKKYLPRIDTERKQETTENKETSTLSILNGLED